NQTVPNLVLAKVGPDGKVAVYNNAGTTHVVLDVVGWFGAEGVAAGDRYIPLPPARILDTRTGGAPVGPGATVPAAVTGVGGVPASGVSAVVLNVTVTQPTAEGYLTVYPSGMARPVASNLNFHPGQTVPNLVVAKVGTDGKVALYNNLGASHVVLDVVGWYSTP
ncbi:MAG: PKD domain-containing protein, partial [Acidimicrobiales bacterium]